MDLILKLLITDTGCAVCVHYNLNDCLVVFGVQHFWNSLMAGKDCLIAYEVIKSKL